MAINCSIEIFIEWKIGDKKINHSNIVQQHLHIKLQILHNSIAFWIIFKLKSRESQWLEWNFFYM